MKVTKGSILEVLRTVGKFRKWPPEVVDSLLSVEIRNLIGQTMEPEAFITDMARFLDKVEKEICATNLDGIEKPKALTNS